MFKTFRVVKSISYTYHSGADHYDETHAEKLDTQIDNYALQNHLSVDKIHYQLVEEIRTVGKEHQERVVLLFAAVWFVPKP